MAEAKKDEKAKSTLHDIEFEGFKFKADTDLLDDVEAYEYVDRIENKGQTYGIVPLLQFMVGEAEYNKMKDYFTAKDAEEHKDEKDYKPRFRINKLEGIYLAIAEKFDPKG